MNKPKPFRIVFSPPEEAIWPEGAITALPRYYKISNHEQLPNYLIAKRTPVDIDRKELAEADIDMETLFEIHDAPGEPQQDPLDLSLLELKAAIAERMLEACSFCERRCGTNRVKGEKGHCGVLEAKVASEFIHWGEEPELIPSYTIFFEGCTFNCVFCQNWDISQVTGRGIPYKPESVAKMMTRRMGEARNVNWVGGDPTSNLAFILRTLTFSDTHLPQLWNSNMYLTNESMRLLDDVMDLYLADFKYGNDNCAKRLSKIDDYWAITTRNHLHAREHAELIIRHLVLPNHVDCCSIPILDWIAEHLENVRVNVMAQYHPEWQANDYKDIDRRLKNGEFARALNHAKDLGLNLTR